MVDCMTDNRNRTAADVRHAFAKHGGNLGTGGSVAYLFTKQGVLSFAPGVNEDALMEAALEAGAEDVVSNDDGSADVITAPDDFSPVREGLTAAGFDTEAADITYNASTQAAIDDRDTAEKLLKMIEALEDLDDVQVVYSNADIAEAILAELEG